MLTRIRGVFSYFVGNYKVEVVKRKFKKNLYDICKRRDLRAIPIVRH